MFFIFKKVPKANTEIPAYQPARGVNKAIDILNEQTHYKFYADGFYPLDEEVLLAYRVFFRLLRDERMIKIKDNKELWSEVCKFFVQAPYESIGKSNSFKS